MIQGVYGNVILQGHCSITLEDCKCSHDLGVRVPVHCNVYWTLSPGSVGVRYVDIHEVSVAPMDPIHHIGLGKFH